MEIRTALRRLASLPPSNLPVLSLVLRLGTKDRTADWLRERADYFSDYYPPRSYAARVLAAAFERAIDHVEREGDGHDGLALFAGVEGELPFLLSVPIVRPAENRVVIDSVPHLIPLLEQIDGRGHLLVMISDSEKARVFEVRLGRIDAIDTLRPDDDAKSFRGEWTRLHFQNWRRDRHRRFVKRKLDLVERLMRERGIEHLVLYGEERTITTVRNELSPWLRERVITASQLPTRTRRDEILAESLTAFARHEQRSRSSMLELLRREIATDGLGAVGEVEVIEALNAGCVDVLLLHDDLRPSRCRVCNGCGRLALDPVVEHCINCGASPLPTADLYDEMVRRVVMTGGRVEPIGESDWLEAHGGVGALLRFRPEAHNTGVQKRPEGELPPLRRPAGSDETQRPSSAIN